MYTNVFKKATDLVNQCEEGYFGVIDDQGYPDVATRSNIKPNGIVSCYFSSDASGRMVRSIKNNEKTSVCFRNEGDNVTLVGTSSIVHDKEVKKELWQDWFINHYPEGINDPEYCIVKFETKRVSLWVDHEIAQFDISEVQEVTSRCGLMCNNCEWKKPYNCKGCIASNGQPFHGECPIAICAQDKGFTHCGECDSMPCDKLFEYSCGDGEHCDKPKGARLDVLRMWKAHGKI